MALQIGIDLGTTNSLIAQFIDGKTQLIPNKFGHFLTPSVVSLTENDDILVGLPARERLATAPQLTVSAFKRFMGTNKIFQLGKKQFRAEELSALILKSLKADAEIFLQQEVTEVVITVPAYFNAIQRQATQHAAELAGLKVLRLLNEPTAAGLAYNLQEQPEDTRFLIYDLGGGTFDVSILEYFDGVVQVSASAGDNHLGGEDFIHVLAQALLQKYPEINEKVRSKITTNSELWQKLEIAKRALSTQKSVEISLNIDEQTQHFSLTQEKFIQAAQPLLIRLRQPLERALRDAKLKPSQIDGIILVGGATRMPIISHSVGVLFKKIPQSNVNPDEAIVRGAAIQAALIARNQALEDIVLTDVMPFSLGTDTVQRLEDGQIIAGRFFPIIERNMPVPISRIERFWTASDNQTQIQIEVLQGESALAKENLHLGDILVNIPPKKSGEIFVDVRFSYDINGLLEVDVSNNALDIQQSKLFQQNTQNLSAGEIEQSRQKLATLKIHPREQLENVYLLEKAKRLYIDYLGDNRRIINEAMAHFEAALETQDAAYIRKSKKQFEDFLARFDNGWLL